MMLYFQAVPQVHSSIEGAFPDFYYSSERTNKFNLVLTPKVFTKYTMVNIQINFT